MSTGQDGTSAFTTCAIPWKWAAEKSSSSCPTWSMGSAHETLRCCLSRDHTGTAKDPTIDPPQPARRTRHPPPAAHADTSDQNTLSADHSQLLLVRADGMQVHLQLSLI